MASAPAQLQRNGANPLDIAVVGLSCRFPGAADLAEYWQLLAEGRSAIRAVTDARRPAASTCYAGRLDDVTRFDPAFFHISEADARAMDPQALLLLEETLKVWSHAGYRPAEVRGHAVGVYVGARGHHVPDAAALQAARNPVMAVGQTYLAANISRCFDLRGPSLVVDSACSSALVAMSTALLALRGGDITSALVAGVSLLSTGAAFDLFEQRGLLSREPRFHVFDGRARGAVLGEGAGVVWLKTVEQARRDGDRIYAVVRALAINNDGRTAGPSAPNAQAQRDVMQAALARSGRQPQEITYVEVNGSGTEVADLIELKAIESVYRSSTRTPCELGSMKLNIGHPLCAEGLASFIKCVLMLHHRQPVPFLSAEQPMAHYDLAASPFYFSRALGQPGQGHGLAALNCFADGGTNAHLILEAWSASDAEPPRRQPLPSPQLEKIELRGRHSRRQRRVLKPASGNSSRRGRRWRPMPPGGRP